jgi:hypothetical protein
VQVVFWHMQGGVLIVVPMQGFFHKQDCFWTLSSLSVHFLVVFWLVDDCYKKHRFVFDIIFHLFEVTEHALDDFYYCKSSQNNVFGQIFGVLLKMKQ